MTSLLRFTKGHGTGNDFVLYSDPAGDRLGVWRGA